MNACFDMSNFRDVWYVSLYGCLCILEGKPSEDGWIQKCSTALQLQKKKKKDCTRLTFVILPAIGMFHIKASLTSQIRHRQACCILVTRLLIRQSTVEIQNIGG
jgi:hypothetical protein